MSALPGDPALSPRIVIVEDEHAIAEILQYNLEREGFEVEVLLRGDQALASLKAQPPDLVLLDLMLPGLDGLQITRLLKADPRTAALPLMMITARDGETDRIVGLELGADDYVVKPFSPREVVLRVKAILRRLQPRDDEEESLEVGEIRIEIEAHRCRVGDQAVELTATEFRLLRTLMTRAGRVQTRNLLLQDVWDYHEDIESRTVDTHIRRLRRKLGEAGDRIETVIGVGYRLRS